MHSTPAKEVGLPGMLLPCPRRCPLLIAPVLCRLSCPKCWHRCLCCVLLHCWHPGISPAAILPLSPLASALRMRDSASSPTMVEPSQHQIPAPPSLLLQAAAALQEVVQATPPGVAKWAAKWRTRPRVVKIKMGEELFGCITLPPVRGAGSPEEGTPRRSPPVPAAPLALPPPSRSDSGDAPQPEVSICPPCSVVSSLRTVGVPAPDHHTLMSITQGC